MTPTPATLKEKFPIWHAPDQAVTEKNFTVLADIFDQTDKIEAELAELDSPKESEADSSTCTETLGLWALIHHHPDVLHLLEQGSSTVNLHQLSGKVADETTDHDTLTKELEGLCRDERTNKNAFEEMEMFHCLNGKFNKVCKDYVSDHEPRDANRQWIRGATQYYTSVNKSETRVKPDAMLRDRPQSASNKLTVHRVLVLSEITDQTLPLKDGDDEMIAQGENMKLQQWVDDLTSVLARMGPRSRLIGLLFHRHGEKYHLQLWLLDHEVRRRAILRDCFGAGLSKLTVIVGVLTHCDRSRLGFLPAYSLQREEEHVPIYTVTLQAEADIGQLERGADVNVLIKGPLKSIHGYIFGRCHQVYICTLSDASADSTASNAGAADPVTIAAGTLGTIESGNKEVPVAPIPREADSRKRDRSEAEVDHTSKKVKRDTESTLSATTMSSYQQGYVFKSGWIVEGRERRERNSLLKIAGKLKKKIPAKNLEPVPYCDIWTRDNYKKYLPTLIASALLPREPSQLSLEKIAAANCTITEKNAKINEELKKVTNKLKAEKAQVEHDSEAVAQLDKMCRKLQTYPDINARHWEATVTRGIAQPFSLRKSTTWQEQTRYMVKQMCQLVVVCEFLYGHDILHRDISRSNVMQMGDDVFLIDFDCSAIITNGPSGSDFELTGQLDCMAIDLLRALADQDSSVRHLARHDLESILYLFFLRIIEITEEADPDLAKVLGLSKATSIQKDVLTNDAASLQDRKATLSFTAIAKKLKKAEHSGLKALFGKLGELQQRGLCGRDEFIEAVPEEKEQEQMDLQDSDDTFWSLALDMRTAFWAFVEPSDAV